MWEIFQMINNDTFSRWHDSNPDLTEILDIIEEMPEEEQEEVAKSILEVIKLIRKADNNNLPVSLGTDKVLSIYKSYQKRRWYDKVPILMSAINNILTLPDTEKETIIQGLLITIKKGSY